MSNTAVRASIVVAPVGFCPGCVRTKKKLGDALERDQITLVPGGTDESERIISDLLTLDPSAKRVAPIVVAYDASGTPVEAWSEMRETRVNALRDTLANAPTLLPLAS